MTIHIDLAERVTHAAIEPLRNGLDEIDGRVAQVPTRERRGIRKTLGGAALVFFAAAGCAGDKCANSCEQAINNVDPAPIADALIGGSFVVGLGYVGSRLVRSSSVPYKPPETSSAK
jgi:hypothetical protein